MDSLATSCFISSNKNRDREKKNQLSCHACQMKQQPGRSSQPDAPALLSLLFKVLYTSHAAATIQNTTVTPSQTPALRSSMGQRHIEIDPQPCCCLRTQPAPPLLRAQSSTQQIRNRTRLSSSRWTQKGTERDWAVPSNDYISKTLKQIFSNISATNDQSVITGKRQT